MTNYELIMKEMTPEKLTQMNVKPVILNNSEPFYLTSVGQLFPFTRNGLQDAVNFEYRWLTEDHENVEDDSNSTNKEK